MLRPLFALLGIVAGKMHGAVLSLHESLDCRLLTQQLVKQLTPVVKANTFGPSYSSM